jgi:hydroxysqualene synthase
VTQGDVVATVEHASGKDRDTENFPVGSLLIAKPLRRHVHAFYRFARTADDIADAADLSPDEKLRRLDRMGLVLDGDPGDDAPASVRMAASLRETSITATHCHELLAAFRQDAVKTRYADWGELMAYCRLSAAPVGRYLLDLHGESRDTWPASDALCAALQVINHLQDCGDDYREIDRVYLPGDMLAEAGIGVEVLAKPASGPALRRVLDRCIAETWPLVTLAGRLPAGVRSTGLRCESAVIVALAERLLRLLAAKDPLAVRAKLKPWSIAAGTLAGILRGLLGERP